MRIPTLHHLLTTGALLAPPLAAQGLQPALVSDSAGDTIWSCTDVNLDGDYNDSGEVSAFYSDAIGPVALTNNTGLIRSDDGALWISDTSKDFILRLIDLNEDGDAHDTGEAIVWFDGTAGNASGVELTSGRGMWRDADGVLWVATANTGGGGNDAIVRLEDVNGDGDANDPGEQLEYAVFAQGGSAGDSIPTAVVRGPDGALYYTETGSTGVLAKGVYRLEDLDNSGFIDQPGESVLFFEPSSLGGSPFHWDLAIDAQGRFYIEDTGNDVIWRFSDDDGDGTADPSTEAEVVYTAPGSSLIWEVTPALDGSLYVTEDQNPDRLLRLVDLNGDERFDAPGERIEIYDETLAVTNLGSPKAVVVIETSGPIGTNECIAAANSTGSPAAMTAFGSTSVASNDVVIRAVQLPQNAAGYFLASEVGSFVPAPGGSQGNLCLGGQIGRFAGNVLNSGAAGEFELALDLTAVPQPTGAVPVTAGSTWRFQTWFRDANPTATSNLTDAIAITFVN